MPTILIGIAIAAALVAYFFGDQIATFVHYRGPGGDTSASIVAIACTDQGEDGSCEGDKGRLENVQLELTQPSGAVLTGSTDANGLHRFDNAEFGNSSLLVTLPFPGRLTTSNPITVMVPAPTGSSSFEVNVFIPVALTGESSLSAAISYVNPQRPGALLGTAKPVTVETVYPGQTIGVEIAVKNLQPLSGRTTFTIIDDFDDQCVEAASELFPANSSTDGRKVTWKLDTQGAKNFDRNLRYQMRFKTSLPEIDPLLCTNRVTILSAEGATLGTATGTVQVLPLPAGRGVLEMTKRVTDLNGGAIKAGDKLQYTLALTNIGLSQGVTTLRDDMPALVSDPVLVTAPDPTKVQVSKTGGKNGTGFIEIKNLLIPVTSQVGEQVTISFTVTVKSDAKTFETIDNYVTVTGAKGAYVEARNRTKVGQVPILIKAQ